MGINAQNERGNSNQYGDGIDEDIPEDFWYILILFFEIAFKH
jgi:hypothetical protein